MMVERE
jgi:hypothetical protein